MKKICVYTCITGDYDNLHEIENIEKNIDYLCFTNNKKIKSDSWKIIYIEDSKLDNQRLSRKIKILGDPYIDKNYDISVWIDASVVFDKKISLFVKEYLKENSFAAFKHHLRDCIYDEAIECIRLRKDKKDIILKNVEFLRQQNYPEKNGLYEMTVFIKKHNDETVKKTMKLWFDMVCKYSRRDQLSFMYCVWATGLKIDMIDLNVWDNEWFHCLKHNYKNLLTKCRIYYGNEEFYDSNLDIEIDYVKNKEHYEFETEILSDTNSFVIELTDVPCVIYSNLKIDGVKTSKIEYFNYLKIEDKTLFYNEHGIVKIIGNFKKKDKFKISIDMHILDNIEKQDFFEKICVKNILYELDVFNYKEINNNLNNKNNELISKNQSLQNEIDKIFQSKSWKITKPIRGIVNLLKRK